MDKTILLVDDDPMILAALKDMLNKYNNEFAILVADDGEAAVKILQKTPISLVVTDLKMPNMDGLSLLAYILEHKPSTPCIVMTAYTSKELEASVKKGGAIGYIEKPLNYAKLEQQIIAQLQKEPDGGVLRGVSLGIFLQLVEMEKKTCTINVSKDSPGTKHGTLFFSEGVMLDAECMEKTGEQAAYTILSWDNVDVAIQNSCHLKNNKIQNSLQTIIFDATRCKDENEEEKAGSETIEDLDIEEIEELEETLSRKIERIIGNKSGVDKIYPAPTRENIIDLANIIGQFFNSGELKLCYLSEKKESDLILVPDDDILAVSLHKKTAKDDIIKNILNILMT